MKALVVVGENVVAQYELPDVKTPGRRRQRPRWAKSKSPFNRFGTWRHEGGGVVSHCGHPTALYPYQAWAADGRELRSVNGGTFRHLIDAQVAVENS